LTGREKIEAAFTPEGSPAAGVVIPYEGIYIRDHWDRLTRCPWWFQHAPDVERQLRWRGDVIHAIGQDWFSLPVGSSREERAHVSITACGDGVYMLDGRTGERRRLEPPLVAGWPAEGGLASVHPDEPPMTTEDIDRRLPPAPQFDAARFVRDGRTELAAALLRRFGAQLYPISAVSSPLWSCYGLWGFEGMMTLVAERPELVKYACERFLGYAISSARRAKVLGCAALWIEECMTDMVSPEAFQVLNLPYLRRLIEEIRALGLKSIYYYCGNPWDRLDEIMSAGADAISLEEGKKGFRIDIEEVVEAVDGRAVVFGNLDAIGVLQDGSEADLRREIARQLAAGRRNGGRFVMSLGSPVTPRTPVERVQLYCDLVREMCRAR